MKKIILSVALALFVFVINAQTKLTKQNVVGNWEIKAISMEGKIYYDFEKDSIGLGKEILEQLAASGTDKSAIEENIKSGLSTMKDMAFLFTQAGKCTVSGTQSGKNEESPYTVDEAKETILIEGKEGKKTFTVSFETETRAKFSTEVPGQGAITFIMQKAK